MAGFEENGWFPGTWGGLPKVANAHKGARNKCSCRTQSKPVVKLPPTGGGVDTDLRRPADSKTTSGEGGIRTRGRGINLYADLANRCIRPLCHLSSVRGGVYQPPGGQSMDRHPTGRKR